MNSFLSTRSEAAMLENSRSRGAEFYFNGNCLLKAITTGKFRKVPFFLRHLWSALAE